MKIHFTKDEYYHFLLTEGAFGNDPCAEVPDEVVERFQIALRAYLLAHDELKKYLGPIWKGRLTANIEH